MFLRKSHWAWLVIMLSVGVALLRQPSPAHAQNPSPSRIYLPAITVGCARELVQDPGFEAGLPNASWVTTSTAASNILDNSSIPSPTPTHSGAWKAWLGGDNSVSETVWQTITVPSWATTMQMSFWFLINTDETTVLNDRVDIQFRNIAGAPLETPYTLWDGDAGTSWARKIVTPTGNYAGQTILLAFAATTDSLNVTNFFVDDVSVQIGCAQ